MSLMTLNEFHESRKGLNDKGILVLDGDWLVFQSMSAAEFDESWEEEIWHRCCDHAKARSILESSIESYRSRKKAWRDAPFVLAFTDDVNWRKELVDPEYKSNRKTTKKPVGYFEFLEALFSRDDMICVKEPRLEGDDIMGIIGSNPAAFGARKAVLVSCDKDFKTVPNCDFLWCTTGNILTNTQESADFWHLFQTIKGDATDGYKGIPGWGDKAEDFLKDPHVERLVTTVAKSGKNKGQEVTKWVKSAPEATESLWDCIVSLGAKAGVDVEYIIKQGRMARILRFDDYNINTGEITLWEPSLLS